MKPEITLSPNEIDRLLETEEKQKRLKRLQEVRLQEKQLSLQRVKQFKAEMKSEWENVVVSLEVFLRFLYFFVCVIGLVW